MPKAVHPHTILAGRLRGYRIVTSWHDYPAAILGRTERELLEWFEEHVHAGETWLDVGAHYGYTAIALSRLVGPGGRVFAFEPEVATVGALGRTRDVNHLPQLIVVPVGLGDPDTLTLARLPVVRGMVDRTLEPDAGALSAFLTARLDWLWDRICGDRRRIDGIKIDVQGMEIEALRGMTALLAEFTPRVVVEVHRGVDRGDLLDLLESAGYARHGEPIEPGAAGSGPQYLDDRSYSFQTP
jgi:FkbM family methyltransferase